MPISYAGIISATICAGTIISSLLSDRITKKLGAGLVTAVSVLTTALALLGFSLSSKFFMLVIFAVPYGLGAGGVDAALNNYVALHLKSRHMSWLHCMWGLGATISPYIMSCAIGAGAGWRQGYGIVSVIQICLTAVLFLSLPLWKRTDKKETEQAKIKPLSAKEILSVRGAAPCFILFFGYCALEQTVMLWTSSYMISHNGISAETAAGFASLFFIGIMLGRGVNGFLTFKFGDRTLIRAGLLIILAGLLLVIVPDVLPLTVAGFIMIGLGCAPVYPCIIHMTPALFGQDKSQAMIGVQMASAYLGSLAAPPLFGVIANATTPEALPFYALAALILMIIMHETVVKKTRKNEKDGV